MNKFLFACFLIGMHISVYSHTEINKKKKRAVKIKNDNFDEDYMEDYPYSRPSGQMSGFNVPLASTVGGVASQSFGGHGVGGGGFPFLPIGTGSQPFDESFSDEYAAENAMENASFNAAEQANAQQLANANANAARNAQELSTELKKSFAYDQPLEKPQIQSDKQIFARGENAVAEMKEKGQVLSMLYCCRANSYPA